IDAPKPFPILAASLPSVTGVRPTFEPKESRMNKRDPGAFTPCRLGIRGQRDDVRTYGEAGNRLVQALRHWLDTTSESDLLALKGKLHALFLKVKTAQRAA